MKSLAFFALVSLLSACKAQQAQPQTGADKDDFGCKASAGYSWSESLQSCRRSWEPVDLPQSKGANTISNVSHTDHRCTAEELNAWIGKNVKMLDPAPEENIRIQTPGAVVSRDYRQNRLTLFLDQNGLVQRAECG